jgi:hypothetical protein
LLFLQIALVRELDDSNMRSDGKVAQEAALMMVQAQLMWT